MEVNPTYEELLQRIEVLERAESELVCLEKRSRAWLDNSPVCTKILDLNFKLQYMSCAGAKILKVDDIREFYGKPYPLDFYPELAQSDMTKALNNALTTKQVNTQEVMLIDFEKNTHWFNSTIVPVCNDKGAVEYFLIVSLDTTSKKQAELALAESNKNLEKTVLQRTEELSIEIAERKKIEKKMTYLATHDSLTDLPNRHLLIDRLEQAFLSAKRNRTQVAIIFIDLDNFKKINDDLGHLVGDQALVKMAARMKSFLRESDTVARFGGDEFVIIMTDIKSTNDVSVMAEKLCTKLKEPLALGNQQYIMGASIGISLYPDNGETSDKLLTSADDAMYRVKKASKNCFGFA